MARVSSLLVGLALAMSSAPIGAPVLGHEDADMRPCATA